MADITIQAADGAGSFRALVVEPAKQPAGAVVLIQEIFGVNQVMRDTAAWVADMGFLAVCPDLFWRLQPGVDLTDKTDAEWQQAMALMKAFDQDKGVDDLTATLAAARTLPGANGRAATMGYCLGGRLAVMMALRSDADANVSYYGVGLDQFAGELGSLRAPLVLHVADHDGFFPAEGRAKLATAVKGLPHVSSFHYDADHGFARVAGNHWNGRAATMANGRSAEALVAALG